MDVRIFKPAKTAMQSGRGKINSWIMEFEPTAASRPGSLMGWCGSNDTSGQVDIHFDSKDDAIGFAKKMGYTYTVQEEKIRRIKPKAYADNFSTNRISPWTH